MSGRAGGRAGAARPYLAGALRAAFDAWLDDAVARHSRALELREIRKGVQALSALYVQRREGADLAARAIEGRGKRAAIATFYAPLHFLTVHHLLAALGPGRLGAVARVLDLGCGTGAAGAAAAATLHAAGAPHPRVVAVDRSGFVLSEARATYAGFGLAARTVRGALPAALPRTGSGDLLVLGWAVNELEADAREALLAALRRALAGGARLLLLEPLAGPATPWWREWAKALAPLGVEEPRHKVRLALPAWIARLDAAAGLDHRVLGARVLLGPLDPPIGDVPAIRTKGDTPAVSVLIPARDAAATLPAALESVRRQSEARFECLVVDDGSRDATRAVAERFAAADPRFRVLATERRGIVPALLDGLAACRAPLVARLDADDLAHHLRFELQSAALAADPRLAAAGCHVRVFPRAGLRPGLRAYERWLHGVRDARSVRSERFVECPLPHPTWMLRREVLVAAPWRDAGWPEDYDLLLRWLEAGLRIGVVPRRLVAWRDGPRRMWRTSPAYAPDRFVACKAHFLARGPLGRSAEYLLWGHGATGRALRRALAAEGREPAAIVEIHPRRIGRRIGGAPVVRPEAIPALRRGLPLVACVSGPAARGEIRAFCARLGLREDVDFWCAA